MIIWRGWGVLVAVFVFGSSLVANFLAITIEGKGYWETHAWPFATSLAVAGVLIWISDAHFARRPARVLVDEKTGERVALDNMPTFFFVRMRWWGLVAAGVGLFLVGTGRSPGY